MFQRALASKTAVAKRDTEVWRFWPTLDSALISRTLQPFYCCHCFILGSMIMVIIVLGKINMSSANRPFSQSETEILRAQLNEVGPKELCCRLGARPLNTTHVWPRSTAPQPDGIGRESILRREENRSTRRNTLGVRLRSTETQPTYDPRPELNLGHRGGRHDWWPLNHLSIEQVSNECRKIKTKVITLANQKGRRQSSKPIKTQSNYT